MVHIHLRKEAGNPYIQQIYRQIRGMILDGGLPAGEKLPSTRELALNLNISRNTVIEAYEMLIAEGYLASVPGSGIYVAEGAACPAVPETMAEYRLTAFASQPLAADTICFHSGTPALELFPRYKWGRLALQIMNEAPLTALGYDYPQGRPELRQTLAAYLQKTRGIRCDPQQILVTTGAKQALTLVAKCLLGPDREAWLEDPTNRNVRQIFGYHTARLLPVPVDGQGIVTARLPAGGRPAFIFVTPSHQFPLGGILPVQRRLELVRFARTAGCYLVEDDYDSEFRFRSLPVSSLQELAPDRVIYAGTFSKTLFPSLRLGYLVLPLPLVEQFREWKRLGDHHSNSLNQLTLTRFIESGQLERHIARMRKVYQKRRDVLLDCLAGAFGEGVAVHGGAAGMHIVAEFAGVEFTPDLLERLEQSGVGAVPVEAHAAIPGRHRSQLILGYAHLSEAELREGINRLRKALAASG
ncbi:GntR family transcriptional regulator [Hydrogenispora ethanolica]|uniref:GntR family transcriptional regulator n=1 Tax=Hydrogenispora ethanolica TaxID=1082276 RepID=A0A4R1QUV7_HYDET|nr:PLP-dependent aminotransferase family protein [Hydrogenispora ethanolica]TCL57708.1 GntR family transcriptional regulator [Hydrogenispora ethanolica]